MTQLSFLGERFLSRGNAGEQRLTLLSRCHLISAKVMFLEIQDQAETSPSKVRQRLV